MPPEAGREIFSRPPGQTACAAKTPTASQLRRMAARLRGTWTSSSRTVRSGWRRSRTARRRWYLLGVLMAGRARCRLIPYRGRPRGAGISKSESERREDPLWPSWNARAAASTSIVEILGKDADELLSFTCKGIPKEQLTLPGPDHVERIWALSDRKPPVLVNLQRLYGSGRLANTGYLSILPVDQGVEHSAAASFAPNPATSIPRTSSAWRSRRGATPSPRRWACSASWPASTPTRSRSSPRSTTTSC